MTMSVSRRFLHHSGAAALAVLHLLSPAAVPAQAAAPLSLPVGTAFQPVPSIAVTVLGQNRNRVTFTYVTPNADKVSVAGMFNGWSGDKDSMTHTGDTFTRTVELPDGVHDYKFVVNGTDWRADPVNPDTSEDNNGGKNSVIRLGTAFSLAYRTVATRGAGALAAMPAGAAVPGGKAVAIPWCKDIGDATRRAATSRKRIMVVFVSPEARASRMVEDWLANDPALSAYVVSQLEPVRVDVTRQPDIARTLQVFRGGTIRLYKPNNGEIIRPIEVFTTPQQLLKELQP